MTSRDFFYSADIFWRLKLVIVFSEKNTLKKFQEVFELEFVSEKSSMSLEQNIFTWKTNKTKIILYKLDLKQRIFLKKYIQKRCIYIYIYIYILRKQNKFDI